MFTETIRRIRDVERRRGYGGDGGGRVRGMGDEGGGGGGGSSVHCSRRMKEANRTERHIAVISLT